ncbi:MAG: hypothetical protein JOZ07_19175 [Solirubrobacterales bacterium]|nr:hypothetical protein [Solirubrobacterales bacterium]
MTELVHGWTIPQPGAFYGAPTLAARLGFPGVTGPMISQACATSGAAIHAAAAGQQGPADGARLVVTTDRTSIGSQLLHRRSTAPGGAPETENWALHSFERDPITGEGMLATAERVAAAAGLTKPALDELTARRYAQYEDALASDRAFQRPWMIPITVGRGRRAQEIDADDGVRSTTLQDLAGLDPVAADGVASYGSQTHPADGTAGMIITTADRARDWGAAGPLAAVLASGFARIAPGTMPTAPVPAAIAALRDAGLLIHALAHRAEGRGLFAGCAAGDTGAALVVEVR